MAELNLVEKVIAFEGVEVLEKLTPEQLASIAMIATEVQLPPGRVILEPGKPSDALYIILDGSVELSREGQPVDTLGQNAVVGVRALFDESDPIPLAAKTREDTRLLCIRRDDFNDLLANNSEITSAIFSALIKQLPALFKRFHKLADE